MLVPAWIVQLQLFFTCSILCQWLYWMRICDISAIFAEKWNQIQKTIAVLIWCAWKYLRLLTALSTLVSCAYGKTKMMGNLPWVFNTSQGVIFSWAILQFQWICIFNLFCLNADKMLHSAFIIHTMFFSFGTSGRSMMP